MVVIKAVEVKVEPRIRAVEVGGGLPGPAGNDGEDGVSVTGASIDGSGHLILTFSSGPPVDVGDVTGDDGADGRSVTGASIDGSGHLILTFSSAPSPVDLGDVTGTDGTDGRSVTGASIDGSGHLILTFSSAPSPVDLGDVTGTDGTNGVSIVDADVDGSYHLILTLSDASTIDAGYVRGPAGADGTGSGDVVGVAPSVAGNFAAYTDTTGKEIEDSGMSPASFATAAQGVTADGAIQGPGTVTSGNLLTFSGTTGKAVAEMSFATLWALTKTLTNTTFDAVGTGNALSNIATSMFASGVIDTDGTLAANSDTKIASQKAVKTYADQIIAAADVMVFKGVIDCSANPDYPAADRGWTYRVSVAGKIGGASGINVEAGDILLCLTDGTVSGDQATVGTNWSVIQVNLDGAVIGPASATANGVAGFDGTTGKIIKQLSASEIQTAASLSTSDSPQFAGINIGHATDTTITRTGAGVIAVEGAVILTQNSPVANSPTLNNAIMVESSANNSSTNFAIDLANGTLQVITLTGNWVPASGWPTATAGHFFRLIVKQDGTGSRTITWPASVKWPASTAPTITATASKADVIDFSSDGTDWFGVVVGQVYL